MTELRNQNGINGILSRTNCSPNHGDEPPEIQNQPRPCNLGVEKFFHQEEVQNQKGKQTHKNSRQSPVQKPNTSTGKNASQGNEDNDRGIPAHPNVRPICPMYNPRIGDQKENASEFETKHKSSCPCHPKHRNIESLGRLHVFLSRFYAPTRSFSGGSFFCSMVEPSSMILPWSRIRPSSNASGRGGQPEI